MCTIVRVTNMCEKAHCKKEIFQELISRVLLEIETSGRVFCTALRPVTICIVIGTIGLLYLFYNTGWHFECLKSCSAQENWGNLFGSFCITCELVWVLRGLAGTISLWAVPDKTAKTPEKMWFVGIKTTNCRTGQFYTFSSWQMFEIFVIHS